MKMSLGIRIRPCSNGSHRGWRYDRVCFGGEEEEDVEGSNDYVMAIFRERDLLVVNERECVTKLVMNQAAVKIGRRRKMR